MGAAGSSPVDGPSFYQRLAYQVLHVEKDSPAEEAGLRPFHDFIVHLPLVETFTNTLLPYDQYVSDSLGKFPVIEMSVFDCFTERVRRVLLKQKRYRRDKLDLTGFIMRPVIINDAILEVEHVQEVEDCSPAHQAGLTPNLDYVIATDNGDCFDLHHIQQCHNPSDYVQIYVFDILVQTSRVVQLPANCKSRFGCTLASGYLHRVPHLQKLKFYLRKTNNHHHSNHQQVSLETPLLPYPTPPEHNHQHHHHHHHESSPTCSASHSHITKNEAVQTDDLPQLNSELAPLRVSHFIPRPEEDEIATPNGTVRNEENGKEISKRSPIPASDSDKVTATADDCCTFVTRIRLKQVLDSADEAAELPVEVNLPKDILRNVISEMVRYEKDEMTKANGQVLTPDAENGKLPPGMKEPVCSLSVNGESTATATTSQT